jgi:hypothetical protein
VALEGNAGTFLHLFVFQCRRCGDPISIPLHSGCASVESLGAITFSLCCRCGWSQSVEGRSARKHWVEPWIGVAGDEQCSSNWAHEGSLL